MRFMAFSSKGNALDLADSMTDADSSTQKHHLQSHGCILECLARPSWRIPIWKECIRRLTETKPTIITVIDIDEDLSVDRDSRIEAKHIAAKEVDELLRM
jgi:hypothetical protein